MEKIIEHKKVIVTDKAKSSFKKDLDDNNIPYEFLKGFHTFKIKNCNKLGIAIRMVKERFGMQSIKVIDL